MAHTYHKCLYHIVFSTKQRANSILAAWLTRLWDYIGQIATGNEMHVYCVGGIENHIHVFVFIPPKIAVADGVRQLKACSSKWVHEHLGDADFSWQIGYGVFTVGVSQIAATMEYIKNQREHHTNKTFEEEYEAFLVRHGIELDEWMLD
jgi:putative transposase